jgi:hypothetical protein
MFPEGPIRFSLLKLCKFTTLVALSSINTYCINRNSEPASSGNIILSDIKEEVDITDWIEVEVIEIQHNSLLNITKTQPDYPRLYFTNNTSTKSILVFDFQKKAIEKVITFDLNKHVPVDFAPISKSHTGYVLTNKNKLLKYNLNNATILSETTLPYSFSTVASFRNYVLLAKYSVEGISPDDKGFYRIHILNAHDYAVVGLADWYNIANIDAGIAMSIIHPTYSFTQTDDHLFYTKFFCDTVYLFNEITQNFEVPTIIKFPHAVSYRNYADLPTDIEKFEKIKDLEDYETAVSLFYDTKKFTIFQFIANGKPSFYFNDKSSKIRFATQSLDHREYGKNLPFPEFIFDNYLGVVVTENILMKNSTEFYNDLKEINYKVKYEGKAYLLLYTVLPDKL